MRQYAKLVIAALLAAGTLGCGNTETNQVTKDKEGSGELDRTRSEVRRVVATKILRRNARPPATRS